jgi:hypothetical protein
LLIACAALAQLACGGGGGGGGGAPNAAALQAEIDAQYPYTPNQPIDVLYICRRSNSQLTYYFGFSANGVLDVFFETDTRQQVSFSGSYTHAGGAIRMLAPNNNILPLDETSARIVPRLGLVGEFETPNMRCIAQAHGHNDPATESFKSFRCPAIHAGPASYEENFFEFSDSSSPFNVVFRGGIFRHREVTVVPQPGLPSTNPLIHRGTGIFRRNGNTFYADFGSQFPDANLLKGSFAAGDQQISVDQLEPAAGPCTRR